MKNFNTTLLTVLFTILANLIFAQSLVKQYSGGTNGSVISPAQALGNDLSNYSTLKLRTPNAKKDNVYQNFIFAPEATKGTRVVFVIKTDASFIPSKVADLNVTFYTGASEGVQADTLAFGEVHITKVNEALNLYEFSFESTKNFDTAGILLHGGGLIQEVKIYKVYLAINQTIAAPFNFISAKK